MSFDRAGWPVLAGVALSAALVLGVAVWRRSWATWLVGFTLLVLAVALAWLYRAGGDTRPRTDDRDAPVARRHLLAPERPA